MLFLYVCLLGCSLSLSVGNEIEFKKNWEDVLRLTKKEIFLPVPASSKECICIPYNLKNTVTRLEKLAQKFNDEPKVEEKLRLLHHNMKHLMDRLERGDKVNLSKSCRQKEVGRKNVLHSYKKFFQSLNESECIKSQ